MCKYDFCKDSVPNNQTGMMKCPHGHCLMTQFQLDKILKAIGGIKE